MSLDDAMLLKCPKTLRQRRRRDAVQQVLQVLKAPFTMQEEVAQDEAGPARSDDAQGAGHRAVRGRLVLHGPILANDHIIGN